MNGKNKVNACQKRMTDRGRRKNLLLLSLLLSVLPILVWGQEYKASIQVSNDKGGAKKDAPIVVRLSELKKLTFDVRSATVVCDGNPVACQLDDMDNDGRKDELCFVYDFQQGEQKTFELTLSPKRQEQTFASRVYADIQLDDKKKKHPYITSLEAPGDSYLYNDFYHHGVAFESEQTAYRIYFDERQNIDLYGKKQYRLELHDTGFYTNADQQGSGYGNDVLWAGQSVGCGTLKLWDGNHPQNWKQVSIRGQRLISNGPVRNVVEVTDRDVEIEGVTTPYHVRTVYTQYAGHRDVRVDVFLDRAMEKAFLCTGVQKIGTSEETYQANGKVKPEGFVEKNGLAASWGADFPEMGKKEQFPPEAVGLSVYVPKTYISSTKTDDLNYLVVLGKAGLQSLHYYISFCAAKEDAGCKSAKEWFNFVKEWDPEAEVKIKIR